MIDFLSVQTYAIRNSELTWNYQTDRIFNRGAVS